MGQAIPTQHPAVALRSHYRQLRVPLAVAMIAVVGLTAAVGILATDDDPAGHLAGPARTGDTSAGSATPANAPGPAGSTRYDGGPEEGTRGAVPARQPGVRYDGGPEEGSVDVSASQPRVTQSQAFPGLASEATGAQEPIYVDPSTGYPLP